MEKGEAPDIAPGQRIREMSRVKDNSQVSGSVKLLAALPFTDVDKQLEEGATAACLW